jgi:uncharacterized protein (DUF736 family)
MTGTGFASAAHGRNGSGTLFSPAAAPHSARSKKAPRRRLPLTLQVYDCGRGSPGHVPSHRDRDGHGLEDQDWRMNMATIGTFKKTATNEFVGDIVTLSVQAKGVRIVPDTGRANDHAPSHRVMVGRAEIGAAWTKQSNEGRDYLGLKLDDPSFNAPIYANLFDDEDGETFNLIWSRPSRRNGD